LLQLARASRRWAASGLPAALAKQQRAPGQAAHAVAPDAAPTPEATARNDCAAPPGEFAPPQLVAKHKLQQQLGGSGAGGAASGCAPALLAAQAAAARLSGAQAGASAPGLNAFPPQQYAPPPPQQYAPPPPPPQYAPPPPQQYAPPHTQQQQLPPQPLVQSASQPPPPPPSAAAVAARAAAMAVAARLSAAKK